MTDQTPTTTETFIYAGQRLSYGETKPHVILFDEQGTSRTFGSKDLKKLVLGGKYEIEVKRHDDGKLTLYSDTAKWLGSADDAREIEWLVLDKAAREEQRARASVKKYEKELEVMEPIRQAYHQASGPQRTIIEQQVLRWLRS